MKRTFSAIFALVLLLSLLAGCAREEAAVRENQVTTTAVPTQPPQREMPAAEKDALLRRLEYSLLCAAISANDRARSMQGWDAVNTQVYLGDYDGDGDEDLVCGYQSHTFDAAERTNYYRFSQSGSTYYTDKNGALYLQDSMFGAYDYELDGMLVEGVGDSVWYSKWDGTQWHDTLSLHLERNIEKIMDSNGLFVRYGKVLDEHCSYELDGKTVSEEDYEAYTRDLGLARLNTYASSFLKNRIDASYADDLLAETEGYLNELYGCRRVDADVDGDGETESLFFLTGNILQVWMDCLEYDHQVESIESASYYLASLFDPQKPRTCLLMADQEGDELVLDALCVQAEISIRDSMDIRFSDSFMFLDGQPAYVSGSFGSPSAARLDAYIKVFGYSDCIIRTVDVSDIPGSEYLCLCQRDGVWYLLIFVFENGDPRPIYAMDLSSSAVYLVEQDGKQCLLTYSQYNSDNYTHYSYSLLRFGDTGASTLLANEYVGYYDTDADATAVAQFFEKLNVYLIKIIVIRDPYRLTGRMWLKQEETELGTVPAESASEQPEEIHPDTQAPVMGFVQINDPSSWLNLREGPGTEYPQVLVDPNNPNSFVKQALGAPVTVLETVTTEDSVNPVWLKVRISYGDREIIGYSSKNYIRIPGEE